MNAAAQNIAPSPEALSFLEREHRLLIGGQWVASGSRESIDVFNPATEGHLAKVAAGGKDDIDRAVMAARKAFRGEWSKLTSYERTRLIWRLADELEANLREVIAMLLEDGDPKLESEFVGTRTIRVA